ncbi:Protein_21.1 [Hexamita inflata]|uniref:Protein 21.1 n=1 Tax=Hexamita inflata TaxID=28002 RepID=A0AA86UDT9_9EUKA|nr:Protein 21.1 [Hexamita inflata]
MDNWFSSVWMNDEETVNKLAPDNLCRVDETGQTALIHAARRGYANLIPILISEAKIQDPEGKTALMHAITCSQIDIVQLLLCETQIQDFDGWSACMHAVAQEDFSSFDLLCKSELNLTNKRSQTILHLAVQLGLDVFVSELVDKFPALLKQPDEEGRTALMFAAQRERLDLVQMLRAEQTITDQNGMTALGYALQTKNSDIVKELIAETTLLGEWEQDQLREMGFQVQAQPFEDDIPILEQKQTEQINEDVTKEEIDEMMNKLGIVFKKFEPLENEDVENEEEQKENE